MSGAAAESTAIAGGSFGAVTGVISGDPIVVLGAGPSMSTSVDFRAPGFGQLEATHATAGVVVSGDLTVVAGTAASLTT